MDTLEIPRLPKMACRERESAVWSVIYYLNGAKQALDRLKETLDVNEGAIEYFSGSIESAHGLANGSLGYLEQILLRADDESVKPTLTGAIRLTSMVVDVLCELPDVLKCSKHPISVTKAACVLAGSVICKVTDDLAQVSMQIKEE